MSFIIRQRRQEVENPPSTLYHMTHIDNLSAILEHDLLAHGNRQQKRDISNRSVNDRRGNLSEPCYGRCLHDYVPLYFNPRNAMLYKTQMDHGSNIVILAFDAAILQDKNTLFTNANAATNDVSFYNNISDLKKLDWNLIFSTSWNGYGAHVKKIMMAEVLVYKDLSADKLESIICSNNFVAKKLKRQLASHNIAITADTSLFFKRKTS